MTLIQAVRKFPHPHVHMHIQRRPRPIALDVLRADRQYGEYQAEPARRFSAYIKP
jgi:hypothetical protein